MLCENEAYGSRETPKTRAASLNERESTVNNKGDNFVNMDKIVSQAIPTNSESYDAHGYSNFDQPPTSILSDMTHFQKCPSSVPSLTYLPHNEMFSLHNNQQQYLSNSKSKDHIKCINYDQNEHRKSDYRNEFLAGNIPPKHNSISEMHDLNISKDSEMPPEPRLSESKRKSLEKTVRLIENMLINTNNNTTSESNIYESDPLASPTSYVKEDSSDSDDEVLIKKVVMKNITAPELYKNVSTHTSTKESEYKTKITEESELKEIILESIDNIKVKVEHTSWSDIDYTNPFHRDSNGMTRHGIGDLKVINMENSVEEAMDTVRNGQATTFIAYFECPHCSLLLIHPKRFLIHVKWHNFGLKNSKRVEKIKERNREIQKHIKPLKDDSPKNVINVDGHGRIYPCKDCDSVFTGKNSLKFHRRKHHANTQMECKICLTLVSGRAELRAHLHTHTDKEHGYHQCPHCPKRFKYRHSLTKHADTHLDKTHECPECLKKFGSENLVKSHMKTHERMARGVSYHCSYCGKGFYEPYNLNVHERTHRNDKPFQCDICKSCFVTNSSLKRHVKVSHVSNKKKPHTCKVCFKCFSTESIRDRHELRAHADVSTFPYPCELCEKRYMKSKDLKNHLYKSHAKEKMKSQDIDSS